MARPTGRGVRAVENGIRSLPPMARRRSLAAHSGNALALAMMLSPHSRYISSTVGLRIRCKERGPRGACAQHQSSFLPLFTNFAEKLNCLENRDSRYVKGSTQEQRA